MGLIYMRISPSGGKYIGQTIDTEEQRWNEHRNEALNSNSLSYDSLLNKAIRKYGAENFSVTILEDNIQSNEELNKKEQYWINFYKTYFKDNNHGYNMTRGGGGNFRYDIAQEDLISLWESGISIEKIAEYYGCHRVVIHQRLIQLGYEDKDFSERRGKIIHETIMTNNYDKDYVLKLWNENKTVSEISEIMRLDRHTVAKVLKFYEINQDEIIERGYQGVSKKNSKAIFQYDKNGIFMKKWQSATEAAEALHLDISSIRKCVKGKRHSCGGFIWKDLNN